MLEAIKALTASRKFLLAVISVIVWAAGRFGLELKADDLLPIVAPIWGVIFGIAVEDVGKGKAAIEKGGA